MLETLVAHWHEVEPQHSEEGLAGKVCDLHQFNFLLWHEEDIARPPDVTDTKIAAVKAESTGVSTTRLAMMRLKKSMTG